MRVTVIFLLFGAFFIFKVKAFYYCHVEQNVAEQWKRINSTYNHPICCEVSEKQWELITWYFLRVGSHLNVTEIVREADFDRQTLYMSDFLKDLNRHTGLEYYTHRVRYNIREEQADAKDTFGDNTYQWHPELTKHENSTYCIEQDKLNIRAQILKKNRHREDEPSSGSVVLATDIEIINHYLSDRESRHPFHSRRTHYIILIYREIDEHWDQLASRILAKLWKVHGILNAIVLSSCKPNNVGIFDPFANTRQLNITDPDIDEWGIFRCFPIKYLDYTDNWLVQKQYSLNGFPLKVSIFERDPTMVRKVPKYFAETHYARGMKKSGYGGIDGLLLGNLAEEMDFSVNITIPDDNSTYGFKWKGEYKGTIGDVLNGRADIAFNGRFLINYGTKDIEYMVPILGDKVCVVMPASKRTPQWKAIFNCFDIYCWVTLFVITAISSVVFAILKWFQEKQERRVLHDSFLYKDFKHLVVEEKIKVKDIFYATWQVMIGMNAAMPFGTVERLLIGSCLLANIIISGSFESSLYTAYTKTTSKDINTLSELDSTGLRIVASSPYMRNTFGNKETDSDVLQSLKDKIFLEHSDLSALDRVAKFRDVCSIERYSDVHIMIKTKYFRKDGTSKLHVIKECPRHHFLTNIVHKDWPLLYRFNRVLLRLAEGGFGILWYEKTADAFIMHSYVKNQEQQQQGKIRKPFSLKDIQAPFYILIIGYIISFIVFLIEKFILTPAKLKKLQQFIRPVGSIRSDFEKSRRNRFKNVGKKNLNI